MSSPDTVTDVREQDYVMDVTNSPIPSEYDVVTILSNSNKTQYI